MMRVVVTLIVLVSVLVPQRARSLSDLMGIMKSAHNGDANGDGVHDVSETIRLLGWLFRRSTRAFATTE